MGKKSKAAAAAAPKESETAEQVTEVEQPASGEQPGSGDQLGDADSGAESADLGPTKRVRFLVSISGHDFNAVPGQVVELPESLAIALSDGERAELVDAPVED